MILGYLLYASRLVPRRMALLGLIGGPLLCASGIAVLFDELIATRGGSAERLCRPQTGFAHRRALREPVASAATAAA